ncbi:antifungal protein ginkbilobin-like protein [Punica granatum]|uniref:Antifungal protein ginkbilobin-like protein n=1 Tax=Punica granatum TaxID=22663 RepID=A0A6P8C6Z2_PUNGR|nr:antifungal protein ginkbilobin-like protein [Punica granatum]
MDALLRAAIIAIGLLCISNCTKYSAGEADYTLLSKICNGQEFSDMRWINNKHSVLKRLIGITPNAGFNHYEKSSSSDHIVYGHAACNGELLKEDCHLCLLSAYQWLSDDDCPKRTMGAQVHLRECRFRFEIYDFED